MFISKWHLLSKFHYAMFAQTQSSENQSKWGMEMSSFFNLFTACAIFAKLCTCEQNIASNIWKAT